MEGIFFIPRKARWNNIRNNATSPEIGKVVDEAMTAIENQNKQLKGVLPKNYARPELEKRRLGEVINLFANLKLHGREEQDLLGRVYEYCLSMFSEAEGKRNQRSKMMSGGNTDCRLQLMPTMHGCSI